MHSKEPSSTLIASLVSWLSTTQQKLPRLIPISTLTLMLGLGGWYLYWQLPMIMAIKTVQNSKEQGNYLKCISLSQAFSHNSALTTQLQTLLQDCQNLQAQIDLNNARQLAEEKKYEMARGKLKRIESETSSYSQAQALLEEWNLDEREFEQHYQTAISYVTNSNCQQALEELYLAAEKAILAGRSEFLLVEILIDERGILQPVAKETNQWEFLKYALIKAEPNNYELTYQRAKLKIGSDRHRDHTPVFELLFIAARQAIENQQSEFMLSQLKQDQNDRFKKLTIGHPEWTQLLQALEQNDRQLLVLAN